MSQIANGLNQSFKRINVDLKVVVRYSNRIMSKKEFYSRKGADKTDSYILIGNGEALHNAAGELKDKGWDQIYGDRKNGRKRDFSELPGESTTGLSEDDNDYIALVNSEYFFKRIEQGLEHDDFSNPVDRAKTVIEHESNHPKFYDHPEVFKTHVEGTIMNKLPKCDAHYDAWMIDRLMKIHGSIVPEQCQE
jgi:hypothetical protein